MTMTRIVSTTVFCAALASGVHAQPLGPGPIGPGPMGLGPIGPGPSPSAVFALRPGPRGRETDDDLKLLVLRGIMQSDPDQAIPIIEKVLTSANSPKVKDRALFVLSQSRSPRARDIIAGVAKGNGNPDLQLRAIRYVGMMGG